MAAAFLVVPMMMVVMVMMLLLALAPDLLLQAFLLLAGVSAGGVLVTSSGLARSVLTPFRGGRLGGSEKKGWGVGRDKGAVEDQLVT